MIGKILRELRNAVALAAGGAVAVFSGCASLERAVNQPVPPLLPSSVMESIGEKVPKISNNDIYILPAPSEENSEKPVKAPTNFEGKQYYDGTICSFVQNPSREEFRNVMQRMSIPYDERSHSAVVDGSVFSDVDHNLMRLDGSVVGEWINRTGVNLSFNKDAYYGDDNYGRKRRDSLEVSVSDVYDMKKGVFSEVDAAGFFRIAIPTDYRTAVDPEQAKDYTDALFVGGKTEQILDGLRDSRYYAGIGWKHNSRAEVEAFALCDLAHNVNMVTFKIGKRIKLADEGIGKRIYINPGVSMLYTSDEVYPDSGSGFMNFSPQVEMVYRLGDFNVRAYVGEKIPVRENSGNVSFAGLGFDWRY